jgi:hypothetical protein
MSVALTEDVVRDRRKTVMRRLGWRISFSALHGTAIRYAAERRNLDESIEELRLVSAQIVIRGPARQH